MFVGPKLSNDFFDKLIISSEVCRCVHFEPVGWQTREDLKRARLDHDWHVFEQIWSNIPINLSKNYVSEHGAWWSCIHDYNVNLVSLLKGYSDDGSILIEDELYECYGDNPFNPSSLISWHKIV